MIIEKINSEDIICVWATESIIKQEREKRKKKILITDIKKAEYRELNTLKLALLLPKE